MDPGSRVDKPGATLAAFPVWTVEITSAAGGATFSAATVPFEGNPGRVVDLSDILRVARASARGALTCTLEAVATDGGEPWWAAFDADDPLEGATLTVSVDDGVVAGVAFIGHVDEVVRLDRTRATVQAREGASWASRSLLEPITAAEWPDAPSESLAGFKPFVFGALDDYVPPLVDDDRVTALEAALTTTGSRATVADVEGWPSSGTIKIDEEELTYSAIITTTTPPQLAGLVRGVNGTTPGSHAPGAKVVEVGPLVYLLAGHALHGADAVSNIRVRLSSGELVALPDDVTPTVSATAPATLTLDRQPEVLADVATPPGLAFIDLDTVAFSDLTASEAAEAVGLADGFHDEGYAPLSGSEGTGGQRAAPIELPMGGTISRAWVVVESFGALEAVTALDGALSDSATTIPVLDTADFPSSGSLWLESGAQTAELCTYTSKSASAFLGVTRGVNSDHQAAVAHPSGARVTRGSGRVHLDLAGGDGDDANAVGDLQNKPQPPEAVACSIVPGAHAFDSAHTHDITAHAHGWESLHAHSAPQSPIRVDGFAVAVKLGQGGGTGSPVLQGLASFGTLPEMLAPDLAGAHDITHTNLPPQSGGYDRINWYAVIFPSAPFFGDARKVLAADFYASVSATGAGSLALVYNGQPSATVNMQVPPEVYAAVNLVVPPDLADTLPNAGGEVTLQGAHGVFETDDSLLITFPANGAEFTIRQVTGTTAPFPVWGGDAGDDDRASLPIPQTGYVFVRDGLDVEAIGYNGARWETTGGPQAKIVLEDITRAVGTTGLLHLVAAGAEVVFPARHSVHRLAWNQAGTGKGGVAPADAGATMAFLKNNPGETQVLQTRLGLTFAAHAACVDPAAWERTVEDFMLGGVTITPGGSLVPFDPNTTNIDDQYSSDLVVPRAPVLWFRAVTNLQVHACWVELVIEDATSEEEVDDELPAAETDTEAEAPLGSSSLSWFDISDLVSSADDLEGATLKVQRETGLGSDDLLVLRMFYVLEVEGATTTTRELPKVVVCDIEGAGVDAPGGTCTAVEAVGAVPTTALGLTIGESLNAASFLAADPLAYQDVALAVLEQTEVAKLIEELAAQFRLSVQWGLDAKLGLAYRPDRDSLPTPDATITADSVARSTLRGQRLPRSQAVNNVTVRAGVNMLEDGAPLITATATAGDADRPLIVKAPAITSQADADDLAAHVVDYNASVPDRVSWRGFVDLLERLTGDLLELDHPDRSSEGLLVERVRLAPSNGSAAFVTIEARDLTPP